MINSFIRSYSEYYQALGHVLIPRYPLLHPAFRTSFVLSAGVIDMKQKLSGNTEGPQRCLLIQPCFRHFDTDLVVRGRHLSLFQMGAALYFDKPSPRLVLEAVLRFLIKDLSINPKTLWLTTFAGGKINGYILTPDEESKAVWSALGLPLDRVLKCGGDQNFWREGAGSGETRSGLCGPHTEVFIDRGRKSTCTAVNCVPGCGCGRFLELANVVFPRFRVRDNGMEPIPWVLAEAALGLDRIAMVIESVQTIFDISTLVGFKEAALNEPLVGIQDVGIIYPILDHVRSFCCLVAEGARPLGSGRGHILRRLLRNAMRIAERLPSRPEETIARVAALLLKYPEACCTINVASAWESISATMEKELRWLTSQTSTECKR